MKPSRFLTAICLLATALAVGSCTQGEGMDGDVQNLPEGMYPLTFTATQGEPVASPQTRVSDYEEGGSHKSKWTTDDRIKVVVSEGSNDMETICTLGENGNITNYNPQLYWKTTRTSKINAWYSNITGQATVTDNTVNLADQRSGLAYVLKAEEVTGVNYKSGNISLQFKHQLAKVRVKLVKGTYEGDLSNATVKINSQYTSCTVSNGTVTASSATGDIPMCKAAYGGDTYEANVVPGKALKDKAFTITAGGKTTQANLESEITLTAGNVYTLTITVKGSATEVNISNISESEYTVEGNILLKGDGQSKDLKLIVEAGSNLTIENVVLEPEGVNVITCRGDATITLKGENTLNGKSLPSGYECSGILVESGTVTIEGDDNAKLTVKGGTGTYGAGIGATNNANITIKGGNIIANRGGVYESAGIGSAGLLKTCGTITITGGIIESWGGGYSAGIGGSNSGSCGNIIITGGNIKAYGGLQSPGIGNGDDASCGTITISGASTVVYAKKGSGKTPFPIGWNNYNGSCGKVTIGSECTVTQE